MKHSPRCRLALATLSLGFALLACEASGQQRGTANGTLTLEGADTPLRVTFAHAYYITGPDSFDETKTTRSLVFTAEDQTDAIMGCSSRSCAELSMIDGLKIDLAEQGMANWWAHVGQKQYSGTAVGKSLSLRVDQPDHLAGTFKIGGSGATAAIEFDSALVKAFDR